MEAFMRCATRQGPTVDSHTVQKECPSQKLVVASKVHLQVDNPIWDSEHHFSYWQWRLQAFVDSPERSLPSWLHDLVAHVPRTALAREGGVSNGAVRPPPARVRDLLHSWRSTLLALLFLHRLKFPPLSYREKTQHSPHRQQLEQDRVAQLSAEAGGAPEDHRLPNRWRASRWEPKLSRVQLPPLSNAPVWGWSFPSLEVGHLMGAVAKGRSSSRQLPPQKVVRTLSVSRVGAGTGVDSVVGKSVGRAITRSIWESDLAGVAIFPAHRTSLRSRVCARVGKGFLNLCWTNCSAKTTTSMRCPSEIARYPTRRVINGANSCCWGGQTSNVTQGPSDDKTFSRWTYWVRWHCVMARQCRRNHRFARPWYRSAGQEAAAHLRGAFSDGQVCTSEAESLIARLRRLVLLARTLGANLLTQRHTSRVSGVCTDLGSSSAPASSALPSATASLWRSWAPRCLKMTSPSQSWYWCSSTANYVREWHEHWVGVTVSDDQDRQRYPQLCGCRQGAENALADPTC